MLRHEVGDINFWKGIRQYYATYRNSNALTADLQRIMEEVSGRDLSIFFKQWLYRGGHPKISTTWHYESKDKSVVFELTQSQTEGIFQFPLEIALIGKDGGKDFRTIQVSAKSQKIVIPSASIPANVVLDPESWLLFEGSVIQK
jgi:aminopeptidase N